jgi:hypothetical protein
MKKLMLVRILLNNGSAGKVNDVVTLHWDTQMPLRLPFSRNPMVLLKDRKSKTVTLEELNTRKRLVVTASKRISLALVQASIELATPLALSPERNLNQAVPLGAGFEPQKVGSESKTFFWFACIGLLLALLGGVFVFVGPSDSLKVQPNATEIPKKFERIILTAPHAKPKSAIKIEKLLVPPKSMTQAAPLATSGVQAGQAKGPKSAKSAPPGTRKLVQAGLLGALSGLLKSGPQDKSAGSSSSKNALTRGNSSSGKVVIDASEAALSDKSAGSKLAQNDADYGSSQRRKAIGSGMTMLDVEQGDVEIGVGLSQSDVANAIHRARVKFQYCQQFFPEDVSGVYKLKIAFRIDSAGRVVSGQEKVLEGSANQLNQCVMEELSRVSFPKPIGGVTVSVSYPFLFSKGDN